MTVRYNFIAEFRYILEKLRLLSQKEKKYEEMYQSLRVLTDKYILLDSHLADKRAEVQEYKKETEQLCLIKYVKILSKPI